MSFAGALRKPGDMRAADFPIALLGDNATKNSQEIARIFAKDAFVDSGGSSYSGVQLPAGDYRIASTIAPTSRMVDIRGQGKEFTRIINEGSGPAIKANWTSPTGVIRHQVSDLSIIGMPGSTTGYERPSTTGELYGSTFRNLFIDTQQEGLKIPNNCFSTEFTNLSITSRLSHGALVSCGPGVTWLSCYGHKAGPGKAAFRLTGKIIMYNCNGVDGADYWLVAGSLHSNVNGFESDFPLYPVSYPALSINGGNLEMVDVTAIRVVSQALSCSVSDIKFDQSIRPNAHSYLRFDVAPQVPPRIRSCEVYADPAEALSGHAGDRIFFDTQGHVIVQGSSAFTSYWNGTGTLSYQTDRDSLTQFGYGQYGLTHNVAGADQFRVGTLKHKVLTPASGTVQPTVTGHSYVKTANTAATTITGFVAPNSAGVDVARNGMLIVEVGDANTTFAHASGGWGLRLKGGTNYVAAQGDVLMFLFSPLYNGVTLGWIQV